MHAEEEVPCAFARSYVHCVLILRSVSDTSFLPRSVVPSLAPSAMMRRGQQQQSNGKGGGRAWSSKPRAAVPASNLYMKWAIRHYVDQAGDALTLGKKELKPKGFMAKIKGRNCEAAKRPGVYTSMMAGNLRSLRATLAKVGFKAPSSILRQDELESLKKGLDGVQEALELLDGSKIMPRSKREVEHRVKQVFERVPVMHAKAGKAVAQLMRLSARLFVGAYTMHEMFAISMNPKLLEKAMREQTKEGEVVAGKKYLKKFKSEPSKSNLIKLFADAAQEHLIKEKSKAKKKRTAFGESSESSSASEESGSSPSSTCSDDVGSSGSETSSSQSSEPKTKTSKKKGKKSSGSSKKAKKAAKAAKMEESLSSEDFDEEAASAKKGQKKGKGAGKARVSATRAKKAARGVRDEESSSAEAESMGKDARRGKAEQKILKKEGRAAKEREKARNSALEADAFHVESGGEEAPSEKTSMKAQKQKRKTAATLSVPEEEDEVAAAPCAKKKKAGEGAEQKQKKAKRNAEESALAAAASTDE